MGHATRILTGFLALAVLVLFASHAGALHPAGDSLAVVRPVLIALVLALAGPRPGPARGAPQRWAPRLRWPAPCR